MTQAANQSFAQLLLIGMQLAEAAAAGIAAAQAARSQVEQMVAEGRDPTAAEWAALNAIGDANRAAIQAAADRAAADLAAAEQLAASK